MSGKFKLLSILFFFTCSTGCLYAADYNEWQCKSVLQQIDSINEQMKKGYSSQQGEYYRKRLRELKEQKYKYCK